MASKFKPLHCTTAEPHNIGSTISKALVKGNIQNVNESRATSKMSMNQCHNVNFKCEKILIATTLPLWVLTMTNWNVWGTPFSSWTKPKTSKHLHSSHHHHIYSLRSLQLNSHQHQVDLKGRKVEIPLPTNRNPLEVQPQLTGIPQDNERVNLYLNSSMYTNLTFPNLSPKVQLDTYADYVNTISRLNLNTCTITYHTGLIHRLYNTAHMSTFAEWQMQKSKSKHNKTTQLLKRLCIRGIFTSIGVI